MECVSSHFSYCSKMGHLYFTLSHHVFLGTAFQFCPVPILPQILIISFPTKIAIHLGNTQAAFFLGMHHFFENRPKNPMLAHHISDSKTPICHVSSSPIISKGQHLSHCPRCRKGAGWSTSRKSSRRSFD